MVVLSTEKKEPSLNKLGIWRNFHNLEKAHAPQETSVRMLILSLFNQDRNTESTQMFINSKLDK